MFERTHIPEAPWWVVEADDKKRARLNCIARLLTRAPYQEVPHEKPIPAAAGAQSELRPRASSEKECMCRTNYANIAAEHAEHMEAHGGEASTSAGT